MGPSNVPFEELDILIALILIVGLVRGVATGAVRQVVSLLGTVAAIVLSVELMSTVGAAVREIVPVSESFEHAIGFVVVFLVIQILLLLAVRLIEASIRLARLTPVNRLVGGVVGAGKAALLLSVLFLVLGFIEVPAQDDREGSVLYVPVASVFPVTWDYAARHLPRIRNLTDRFGKEVDHVLSTTLP